MENPVVLILAVGTLLTELSLLTYLALKMGGRFSGKLEETAYRLEVTVSSRYREIGLALALIATSGSLYLSNVLGWTPCRLCWFQRIFMYPLLVMFAVALLFDKKDVSDYSIPLAIIGVSISAYHFLIQFLPALQSTSCSITEVSCEATYTFYFGHITIPVMAGVAFLGILAACYENYS
jgi:disulfide bond formation protein DsbB